MNNRFPKSERLCSRYLIDKIFEPGNSGSFLAYPLRMAYRVIDKPAYGDYRGNDSNALLISVPKRYFKHAVDRNHVKRQVREAYRNNHDVIQMPEGKVVHMAMIWLDTKHYPTAVVEKKVLNLLRRMTEKENA
jgi:ribonuclease P protein component